MQHDQQLLRRYAVDGCEAAFGELVAHHVNLVYSAALRQTNGDAHLARDIAQLVFSDLARKAGSISRSVVLAGWLLRATRYAAAQLRRTEQRRRRYEGEAVKQHAIQSETSAPEWETIRPLLDEALDRLSREDRDALVLRYFEQRSLAEVGAAIGSNEDAARKRIGRALEKMREFLGKRGVSTTTAALTTVISANAVQIAPAGLAATLTSVSLAGAATGNGTLALLKIMTMTKLKAGLGAMVVAGMTMTLVVQHLAEARLRGQNESLRRQSDQLARLATDNQRLSNLVAQAGGSRGTDLDELLKLRSDAGLLREQTNDLAKLKAENTGLQARNSRKDKSPALLQIQDEGFAKMFYAQDWMRAFTSYADKNHGQYPVNFAQAASLLPDHAKEESLVTTDQFEIVYHGNMPTNETIQNIIVLREKQAWQSVYGQWARTYAFADGHCQIASQADGNFAAFEERYSKIPLQ